MSAEQTVQKAVALAMRTAERLAAQSQQELAVKQETLRAEFEAVMASESLDEREQLHGAFLAAHGQDGWDHQLHLGFARARKEQMNG